MYSLVWSLPSPVFPFASHAWPILMSRDLPLGPFHVDNFLVPPPRSKAPRDTLVLEDFTLRWRQRQIVGLDIIHEDQEERTAVLREGLTWRGLVHFSNQAHNKKQISGNGLELLHSYSERKGIRIDWQAGFWVNLEGKYWRHTYEIGMCLPLHHYSSNRSNRP